MENFCNFFLYCFFFVFGDFFFMFGGVFIFWVGEVDLFCGVVIFGLLVFGVFIFLGGEFKIIFFFLGMIVFCRGCFGGVFILEINIFKVFNFFF